MTAPCPTCGSREFREHTFVGFDTSTTYHVCVACYVAKEIVR